LQIADLGFLIVDFGFLRLRRRTGLFHRDASITTEIDNPKSKTPIGNRQSAIVNRQSAIDNSNHQSSIFSLQSAVFSLQS
jgi:hypothetical protein